MNLWSIQHAMALCQVLLIVSYIPLVVSIVPGSAANDLVPENQSVALVGGQVMKPVETIQYVMEGQVLGQHVRRRLAPFQLCLACKCCSSGVDPATCATMPCCFGIDCQLPNKPFGVCAFVPKTCNCTSCPV